MSTSLICGACGNANEPERVYCHHCGAKLDRSILPVAEEGKKGESAEKARKRIKQMTNPSKNIVGYTLKMLITVAFWSSLIAALIVASRKPEGVPDPKAELPSRLVQSDLMDAIESAAPRTIAFTEDESNAALKQSLRAKISSAVPGMEFQRAYVNFLPSVVHVGMEQSLWGFPVYSGVDYKLAVIDGKLTPILLGGNFGRLPVRVEVMKYLDMAFQKLWEALKRERGQMDRVQSVTVIKGQIIFVTKAAAAR